MKYIKTYERILNANEWVEPEVLKIKKFLEEAIMNAYHSYNILRYIQLEKDEEKDKIIYSLIFSHISDYFVCQFDYKNDEVWIKYLSSCSQKLQGEIDKLYVFFNSVTEKFPDYETGWIFDKETIRSKFNDFDMYIDANKYNL